MNKVQALNRLMLLFIAPFIGIVICLYQVNMSIEVPKLATSVEYIPINLNTSILEAKLEDVTSKVINTKPTIESFDSLYEQSALQAAHMLSTATASALMPEQIYDQDIISKLGRPARHESSDNIDLKLFVLNENKYKGYAMKVKLKSDQAMKLVLSKDKLGEAETTLQAVNRYKAVAGVNAGRFIENKKDLLPIETTIIDGQYTTGFNPSYGDSIFIGLNHKRELIGSKLTSQSELDQLNPQFGVTAGPILVQNGLKTTIPSTWQASTARSARTVIANYTDNQLLFLVIEGDETNNRSGATLHELQDQLIRFGVKDAYNLDGGGSSSLVLNNEMFNQPADGKARSLATHFLFFK